jgi:hypothetical protein
MFEAGRDAGLHDTAIPTLDLGSEDAREGLPEGWTVEVTRLYGNCSARFGIGEGDLPVAIEAEDSVWKLQKKVCEMFVSKVFQSSCVAPLVRKKAGNGVRI